MVLVKVVVTVAAAVGRALVAAGERMKGFVRPPIRAAGQLLSRPATAAGRSVARNWRPLVAAISTMTTVAVFVVVDGSIAIAAAALGGVVGFIIGMAIAIAVMVGSVGLLIGGLAWPFRGAGGSCGRGPDTSSSPLSDSGTSRGFGRWPG